MNNTTQYIITCRVARWDNEAENQITAFAIRYLIKVPIEEEDIEQAFKVIFKEKIKKDFDGEILFIDEVSFVIL